MFDFLDKFLAIASKGDFVSPLVALAKDATNGRCDIEISRRHSVNSVKRLLRRNGVESWGEIYQADTFTLTVGDDDYQKAQDILRQNRVI